MIKFKIHTWSCGCGYYQDCEPTKENMELHFNNDPGFRLTDLKENECPNCALHGKRGMKLEKEMNNAKKCEMAALDDPADLDKIRTERLAKPPKKFAVGNETRLETDEEFSRRIDGNVAKMPEANRASLKARMLLTPKMTVTVPIEVFETATEQKNRIEEELKSIKIATPEQVKALRDKYESL